MIDCYRIKQLHCRAAILDYFQEYENTTLGNAHAFMLRWCDNNPSCLDLTLPRKDYEYNSVLHKELCVCKGSSRKRWYIDDSGFLQRGTFYKRRKLENPTGSDTTEMRYIETHLFFNSMCTISSFIKQCHRGQMESRSIASPSMFLY